MFGSYHPIVGNAIYVAEQWSAHVGRANTFPIPKECARECLHIAVQNFNKQEGHKHSHMCTNINHYLIDTLDAPSSVRNFKDFRKQVLSKFLTQTKNDSKVKQSEARIKSKQKKIKRYQDEIRNIQMKINADAEIVDSNKALCSSLSLAIKKK